MDKPTHLLKLEIGIDTNELMNEENKKAVMLALTVDDESMILDSYITNLILKIKEYVNSFTNVNVSDLNVSQLSYSNKKTDKNLESIDFNIDELKNEIYYINPKQELLRILVKNKELLDIVAEYLKIPEEMLEIDEGLENSYKVVFRNI
ncbi:hypothetical protein [Enterococcus sp. N249-2]